MNSPMVTPNGNPIPVLFSGLTPTLAGLYQINFQIPTTFAAGNYALGVSQNGVTANQTMLAVKTQ